MQASAISTLRRERVLMAFEQARHLLRRLQVPLGIGLEAEARVVDRAFLADAGEHVLQGAAMRRVIEHGIGGDEGYADARGEIGERCDAGAIVAAIRMPRREIELVPHERLLDAPNWLRNCAVSCLP